MITLALFIAYILIVVCALAAVVLPFVKALDNPQSLKGIGVGIGSLLIVFILSYIIADGNVYENASATTSKMVGAGIISFYILAFGIVITIIYTELKKIFT